MSAFKDMIAADLDDIFFDAAEFAEEHDLNGTRCFCVVEGMTAREGFQQSEKYEGYDVVRGATNVVHVKKADLGEMPVEGEVFKLDGEIHYVRSCAENMGMLSIYLRANISGWG